MRCFLNLVLNNLTRNFECLKECHSRFSLLDTLYIFEVDWLSRGVCIEVLFGLG